MNQQQLNALKLLKQLLNVPDDTEFPIVWNEIKLDLLVRESWIEAMVDNELGHAVVGCAVEGSMASSYSYKAPLPSGFYYVHNDFKHIIKQWSE